MQKMMGKRAARPVYRLADDDLVPTRYTHTVANAKGLAPIRPGGSVFSVFNSPVFV